MITPGPSVLASRDPDIIAVRMQRESTMADSFSRPSNRYSRTSDTYGDCYALTGSSVPESQQFRQIDNGPVSSTYIPVSSGRAVGALNSRLLPLTGLKTNGQHRTGNQANSWVSALAVMPKV